MVDLAAAKEMMIQGHLVARGIRDPAVLAAMRQVPREEFVPEAFRGHAYDDSPLPIEERQTISQPYIVAFMTEALELVQTETVLEIGTGSGYAAAILSRIARWVHTVEHFPSLAATAAERLKRLGYDNAAVHVGDGTLGWPEHAPYAAVVVTAGAPEVPQPLLDQLEVGGRLVIPVGGMETFQTLIRVRRVTEKEFRREYLTDVRFVPLVGEHGWNRFR